jgi:hypothetical protein
LKRLEEWFQKRVYCESMYIKTTLFARLNYMG